jgi:outer membrane protein OmpA-like peptidoglycan-associated protein
LEGFGWEWSHGVSAVGATMRHTFTKPGRYTLQLSAAGHGAEAPRACGACVTREVVVIPADQQRKLDQVEDSLKIAWSSPATKAPSANLPCTPQEPENYCYRFTDEGGVASDTMPLIYLWDLGDGHSKEGQEVYHCYERPGVYNVRLEILDPYSRQRISLRTEYELDVQDIRQVYIDSYDTVALGADMAMNAYRSDAAGCKVASVYWNFGDGETAFGPEVTHQYARRGSYRVQMVLQGTDQATGEPCTRCSYKQLQVLPGYRGNELRDSLRQSTSVAAHTKAIPEGTVLLEIVKEGYEKHHLSFDPQVDEGVLKDSVYLKPIVSATTVLVDVRDERTGLRLRDVTILLQDLKTGFALGEFLLQDSTVVLPLEPGQTYYLLARKQGYLTQVESIGPIQKGGVPISLHMNLSIAEIGKSWVIHNLYYDFDKSHIRNDAAIELAKLVVFLDANPQVTIELGSHTDMRGSDAYNLALAQARAESAVAFLHAKGIAIERIIARGYGEQKPVNRCTNGVACSEAEHQENRRTEITILGLKDPIYSLARPVEDIWGTASIMIPSTPSTAGPFTILLGTYTMPKEAAAFEALAGTQYPVTAREMDGFWLYSYGDYPNYDAANANLQAVISRGYPHATVLVVPPFTLPAAVRAGTPITKVGRASLSATGNPDDDGFYAVQVAVLGRSVQPSFLESFGDYRSAMYERDIAGRRVFFVGRYATEQEAMNHLAKIRRTGHGDAFLVRFEHGNKVNLDKIGGQ